MTIRHLDALNHPQSIAVIGGSSKAGSLGTRVLENIIDGGFAGTVFAVNPDKVELDDVWWVASIADLPRKPDLAIVVTPAATIPAIIDQLGTIGTRVVTVISSVPHDATARQAMLDAARPHDVRLIGPNCLGLLLPHAQLNASFAPHDATAGRLAFLSQSGALVTAMLDWAADRHVGFSGVVSLGDMTGVGSGTVGGAACVCATVGVWTSIGAAQAPSTSTITRLAAPRPLVRMAILPVSVATSLGRIGRRSGCVRPWAGRPRGRSGSGRRTRRPRNGPCPRSRRS